MFEKIWKWLKKFNSKKNRLIHGKYHKCSLRIVMISPKVPLTLVSCWKSGKLETHRIHSYYIFENKVASSDSTPHIIKTRMGKWYAN